MKAKFSWFEELFPSEAPMAPEVAGRELTDDEVLTPVYLRGDRWMRLFILGHLILAFGLAPVNDTWIPTLVAAPLAFLVFWLPARFSPGTCLTRGAAGLALQIFVGLHIYQMHGMTELHFLFFTSTTMLIMYADWRCMWPAAVFVTIQHTSFALLHNFGVPLDFFEQAHVSTTKLKIVNAIFI